MSCRNHPQYQAKRKPRSMCTRCWELWFYSPFNLTHATLRLRKLLNDRDNVAMRDKQQMTAAYAKAMN